MKPRYKIIGKFVGGCGWESAHTFTSLAKATATMKKWKKEECCRSTGYRIVQINKTKP